MIIVDLFKIDSNEKMVWAKMVEREGLKIISERRIVLTTEGYDFLMKAVFTLQKQQRNNKGG